MKKIAIYCVNYHSYDSLHDYLVSIDEAMQQAGDVVCLSVIVADNTAPAEPVSYKPQHFSLQVVVTGDNRGYFGAVRYAMQQVSPLDYDFAIISNVDVLLESDFFNVLSSMQTSESTGWIAPTIFSQTLHFNFNPQAVKRYSLRKMKMLRFMFKYPILLKIKQKLLHQYHDIKNCKPGKIYAGHGSFIILTRNFFQHCGIIDYPIFLYGEEIFLAEVCRRHQLIVEYTPQIRVQDIGKVSTGKFSFKSYCRYNYQSTNYIINTYY